MGRMGLANLKVGSAAEKGEYLILQLSSPHRSSQGYRAVAYDAGHRRKFSMMQPYAGAAERRREDNLWWQSSFWY